MPTNNITLSAGVRQNLLSLQSTAQLMSLTQNRLATGKKVNTALDNPANFFTSSALNNRAGDLNALLDSIGQAQQTLDAADKGLTSLTKLVESAKSIAKQARQSAQPTSNSFGQITITGNAQTEVLGTVTGTGDLTAFGANGGNLILTVNGVNRTIALANADNEATILSKINAVVGATGTNEITATADGAHHLVLTANNADVDFTIAAASTDATTTALGLTEGNSYNSTSLLDRV